jgi:hypothetical protein
VLLDEVVQEIEDFPLALGQWQHDAAHYTQTKSESQPRAVWSLAVWSLAV